MENRWNLLAILSILVKIECTSSVWDWSLLNFPENVYQIPRRYSKFTPENRCSIIYLLKGRYNEQRRYFMLLTRLPSNIWWEYSYFDYQEWIGSGYFCQLYTKPVIIYVIHSFVWIFLEIGFYESNTKQVTHTRVAQEKCWRSQHNT